MYVYMYVCNTCDTVIYFNVAQHGKSRETPTLSINLVIYWFNTFPFGIS